MSHNYLRNHDFNLWFTIADAARLEARPGRHARRAQGAERRRVDPPAADAHDVQDQHEPRDGGRHRRARGSRPRRSSRCRARPIPIDDFDVAVIRALQGPMAVRTDAYAPAAERLGIPVERLLEHLGGMVGAQAAAPRRGDPVPPPRRLLGERHGRLEGARGADRGARPADGGRARRLALLPAARPIPTGPTASSRWRTGARRRSATRCSTASPTVCGLAGADRATLYSSTEYKKVRLHYFTPDYAAWEARYS